MPLGSNATEKGNLFIDIETIPGQSIRLYQRIKAEVTPPANISKEETLQKWWEEKAPAVIDERWRKTALDGSWGEIFCIGWAVDERPPEAVFRDPKEQDSERRMLLEFWDRLGRETPVTWIGHYLTEFDLRFLWQRSVINNVVPSQRLPINQASWEKSVEDTMFMWAGRRGSISLENLCEALGIDTGQNGMSGKDVWDYVRDDKHQEVVEYCIRDVMAVREVYKRLTFGGVS